MEILNSKNCLNKRRMRKNQKQKERKKREICKKIEEIYLKRLYGSLCAEMLLDKYFDDEERIAFPTMKLERGEI